MIDNFLACIIIFYIIVMAGIVIQYQFIGE